MKILHDQADIGGAPAIAPAFGKIRKVLITPEDVTCTRAFKAGNDVDERAFSRAGTTRQSNTAACCDFKMIYGEHRCRQAGKRDGEIFNFQRQHVFKPWRIRPGEYEED
ncbi:hypothetical protein D3C80_1134900 [compost metagenome]